MGKTFPEFMVGRESLGLVVEHEQASRCNPCHTQIQNKARGWRDGSVAMNLLYQRTGFGFPGALTQCPLQPPKTLVPWGLMPSSGHWVLHAYMWCTDILADPYIQNKTSNNKGIPWPKHFYSLSKKWLFISISFTMAAFLEHSTVLWELTALLLKVS